MQIWITDFSFLKSAQNLDTKRLQAQIYEGIHILSSLLDINNKLVNPKRNVKNHPAAKLWSGYERELYICIQYHIMEWRYRGYKYENTINYKNNKIIFEKLGDNYKNKFMFAVPSWISEDLIKTHKSVLIQKKPEHYKKLWPDVPDNLKIKYDWRNITYEH